MTSANSPSPLPIDRLSAVFLQDYPAEAARRLATMSPPDAAAALGDHSAAVLAPVFERLSPGVAEALLVLLPPALGAGILTRMDTMVAAQLLARLPEDERTAFLGILEASLAKELRALSEYPEDSAGGLMQTKVLAFDQNLTVDEAIAQLKHQRVSKLRYLYLLGEDLRLVGVLELQQLVLAAGDVSLASLSAPLPAVVSALGGKDEVVELLKSRRLDVLPVVDVENRLLGTIEGQRLIDALRDDLAASMQTMVGVSREERALSSSWFAVKKRLPWLQINLLTAFLAAAVVGAFEATIAKYTALAILLPIAAGQSGNTGAQALAVTMRGLTLREVTVRHWWRISMKELGAGLLNGVAVALTCGLGVYLWSQSLGLSLIIGLAMISSMAIAAVSGALVPLGLKRLGQDPALSSSIILTTITDIAGFMSFLGIATLLSGMLDAGGP